MGIQCSPFSATSHRKGQVLLSFGFARFGAPNFFPSPHRAARDQRPFQSVQPGLSQWCKRSGTALSEEQHQHLPQPRPHWHHRHLRESSGYFKYTKHTATEGNPINWFFLETCSSVSPKKTGSLLWLKGKKKEKKSTPNCSLCQPSDLPAAQRDLSLHNTICVTLHWPENLTREDNTQHQAPLLQPPQFNNLEARKK